MWGNSCHSFTMESPCPIQPLMWMEFLNWELETSHIHILPRCFCWKNEHERKSPDHILSSNKPSFIRKTWQGRRYIVSHRLRQVWFLRKKISILFPYLCHYSWIWKLNLIFNELRLFNCIISSRKQNEFILILEFELLFSEVFHF